MEILQEETILTPYNNHRYHQELFLRIEHLWPLGDASVVMTFHVGSNKRSGPLEDSGSDKRSASGAPLPRIISEQNHGSILDARPLPRKLDFR